MYNYCDGLGVIVSTAERTTTREKGFGLLAVHIDGRHGYRFFAKQEDAISKLQSMIAKAESGSVDDLFGGLWFTTDHEFVKDPEASLGLSPASVSERDAEKTCPT